MINYEKVASKIFSIIKGHNHDLIMFTEDGMETSDAQEARRFFVKNPNYMVTLDGEARHIKINKNSNVALEDMESIMKQLKNLATANMLKTEIRVFGKEITPKDFAYQAKNMKGTAMENIQEASFSRMHGFKKTSYQTLESTKIVVRHRRPIEEEVQGSRARNIQAIFIEHAGERFRFPHNNLAGARAMARHINEGGEMQDTIGKYIIESINDYNKLMEFVRYARTNKLINEESEDVVKTVRESMNKIRREMSQFQGAKTYESIKKTVESSDVNVIEEDGEDVTELTDMFTVRKFDEKVGDILPIVKRLMDTKQEWRNALVEASEKEVFISGSSELSETEVFEFDSPVQRMGYQVKDVADRMIGESDLQTFVGKVAGKLIEGEEISAFEKKVVGNVLGNAVIKEEEEICEGCGEIHEDCKCGPKDVVDLISDSFELKMKMLEHEDIFTEAPATADDVWPTKPKGFGIIDKIINAIFVVRGNDDWNTDVIVDHLKAKGYDDGQIHQIRDTVTKATKLVTNRVATKYGIADDQISMLSGNFGVYTFFLGVPDKARQEAKQLTKDLVARKLEKDAIEPALQEDRRYGKPSHPMLRKIGDKRLARKLVPGLGKREAGERTQDNWFTSRMYSAAELEDPEWEMDDEQKLEYERAKKQGRRYNRIARGETPFKKSGWELEEAPEDRTLADPYEPQSRRECGNCGDFSSVLQDRYGDDLHYVCDTCGFDENDQVVDLNFAGEVEDDGQPSEYDEWQDYMGGDDWDHGQYDESRMLELAGVELKEGFTDWVMKKTAMHSAKQAHKMVQELGPDQAADTIAFGNDKGKEEVIASLDLYLQLEPEGEYAESVRYLLPAITKHQGKWDDMWDDVSKQAEKHLGIGVDEGMSDSQATDPEDFMDDCPDCDGTGKGDKFSIFDDEVCLRCGGEGYV